MKIFFTILVLLGSLSASAQKRTYSLFHPVPQDSVREEMETDRPNVTETPYTVDAGHIQYEASLVNLERKRMDKDLQRTWLINHADVKLGLLQGTNLHVVLESYGAQKLSPGDAPPTTSHGIGELTIRIKQSLFGNYKGNFSSRNALCYLPDQPLYR